MGYVGNFNREFIIRVLLQSNVVGPSVHLAPGGLQAYYMIPSSLLAVYFFPCTKYRITFQSLLSKISMSDSDSNKAISGLIVPAVFRHLSAMSGEASHAQGVHAITRYRHLVLVKVPCFVLADI